MLLLPPSHTHTRLADADYALTPSMAIVDPQLVLNMPKKLTAWGGIDALTHALESYVSICATGEGGRTGENGGTRHEGFGLVGALAACVRPGEGEG